VKKKPARININLVPKDPFFESPIGKTLRWALSVGRYIVIFTELIVIFSFGTRFSLDRRVTDLNDSINQKQSIIQSYGELEDQVRLAQFKIEQYQQVEQQSNLAELFPVLSEITPRDIRLEELVIKSNGVILEGTTLSQNSFNILINNMQLSPQFFNITVDRIETNKDKNPGLHFRLRADTQAPQAAQTQTKTQEKTNILDRTQGL
jgi:hypothetical protein